MDAATLYTLIVCTGTSVPCERPFGWAPSFDREECLMQMCKIRARDHDKRLLCFTPGRIGGGFGSTPGDIIDSAEEVYRQTDFLDMLGQPGQR